MALTREWVELALKQAEANDASFVAPEFRESQRNYAELCRHWLATEQDARDAAALARENAELRNRAEKAETLLDASIMKAAEDTMNHALSYSSLKGRAESAESANRALRDAITSAGCAIIETGADVYVQNAATTREIKP